MRLNPWDFSNQVLYDLCSGHSAHVETGHVLAKILLVGRVYAAAIERRRTENVKGGNDDFYLDTVAPILLSSRITVCS